MAVSRTEDFKKLILRLDPDCMQHFQGAMSLCTTRAHFEVTPEHLLLRLLDDASGDVNGIFAAFKVERAAIRRALQRVLDDMPSGNRNRPAVSPKLVELLQAGLVLAEDAGHEKIRPGIMILAYALNPSHTRIGEYTPELERIDTEQLRNHFDEIVGAGGGREAGAEQAGEGASAGRGEGSALEQFTIDLTAKAAAGQIDPVFGRDAEIRQMIDIFARRRKNNPILVGEPGTGKTAIVEGLALRIVKGDVPPTLKGVQLRVLDLGLLQAGAGVKGEFENRLKNVIREIKASPVPIVSFIDEAHMLIGAGGQAGGGDAANMLKPALARGELRTVAATTWAEYKKYFEKDAALERRFQLVRCDEPTAENATVMLRGLKDKYESHHKVIILDEAVTAAVQISKRYISGRFLPDKAVDLLDTAAARVGTGLNTRPAVLDDLDRQITSLDTAIAAMQRDREGGTTIETDTLAAMEQSRTVLHDEREKTEAHWKAELEAVNKVRELRSKLKCYKDNDAAKVEKAEKPEKTEKAEPAKTPAPAAESKPAAAPAAEENEDEVRTQIDAAVQELKKIQGEEPMLFPHVDAATIAAIVSDWTGIPVGKMVGDEINAVLQMEDRLRDRVVGQDHALKTVAQKLRSARSGLKNPAQPMGVFLCVGPSGVGKTELAMSVADLLFGGDSFLTTINMSEFMESHTVSQLKGSPPGYVGYGEGGVLTEAVRQHPYSVVLLDEVEKAHPDVMNLFYQVFDKGSLADGEGRIIDFKNTVIFLTSNLGTDAIQGMCESGEVDIPTLYEAVYPHLRNHFKPALVARMTVIPFLTLSQEVLKNIAKMKVRKLGDRLTTAHRITMKVDDNVYEQMAAKCNQVDIGARQIDHLIDSAILPELSKQLLEQMATGQIPQVLTIGISEAGEFTYTFSNTRS